MKKTQYKILNFIQRILLKIENLNKAENVYMMIKNLLEMNAKNYENF